MRFKITALPAFIASAVLCLFGCAETSVVNPTTGQKFKTQADAGYVYYQDGTTTLQITDMNHSTATRIVWHGVNKLGATVAGAVIAGMGLPGASAGTVAAARTVTAVAPHVVNATTAPTVTPATPRPVFFTPTQP